MDAADARPEHLIKPSGRRFTGIDQRAPLKQGLIDADQFHDRQTAGRFFPIACVALEITQRCNLDCSLCYLSEAAEMAHDVPLPVLFDRIAQIHSHYGPGTSVQISGGDPTLRSIDDLKALCHRIRTLGMRSCMMTNGIRATRSMLSTLAKAGLDDVAFHVDLTQERKGYATEADLNAIRAEYIGRAEGLGLRILFNTTVYDGNLAHLPDITRFFRDNAEHLTLISFQLQADTGRGVLRERADQVTQRTVMDAVTRGIGAPIDFDGVGVGHSECNRYAALMVAGNRAVSALPNKPLIARLIAALDRHERRRDGHLDIGLTLARIAWRKPWLALRAIAEIAGQVWRLRGGLIASRGRIHRMSVLVHNFMDGAKLDMDRCKSCVFMVATRDGPLSMCVHNAKRDAYLFAPAPIQTDEGQRWWSAATGNITDAPAHSTARAAPPKLMKGRQRQAHVTQRPARPNSTPTEKASS